MFADNNFSNICSFIFKVIHLFTAKEDDLSEKVVTDEEELDGIDIGGIGILEESSRHWNLKIFAKNKAKGFASQ